MPSWEQSKDDFEKLCNMWDKAQDANIFTARMNPRNLDYQDNHESEVRDITNQESQTWNLITDNLNPKKPKDGNGFIFNEETESVKSSLEKKPKKKTRKKKVKKLANQPNKIFPDGIGPDGVDDSYHVRVSAGWSSDPNFDKLVALHDKKYEKEVERNKAYPNDENKIKKLEKELKKLKDQIAKLSDEFYGNYTDNEYYN